MRILIGKKLKDYESYNKDRERFLRTEEEKLRVEKGKVKEKFNAFCKEKEHTFVVKVSDYGDIIKTCAKCPMTIRVTDGDY